MVIYLDLDRTLFRTTHSGRILLEHVGQLYPSFDVAEAIRLRDSYYIEVGELYYHDMSRQLSEAGLEPSEVYEALATTDLADGRFEFDGCRELIASLRDRAELKVFTFGPDDYQRFKVSLCPSLAGLSVMTTLRPKSEMLQGNTETAWFVDDRPIGDELPPGIRFVQVSLEDRPAPLEVAWPVMYSLRELKEFFDDAL